MSNPIYNLQPEKFTNEGNGCSMKIGVIGAGFASSLHSKVLKANKNVKLYVYDIKPEIAQDFALKYGLIPMPNLYALFDSVDAVIIATPSYTHHELVLEAIGKGKHVLCEKPMANSSIEAVEMYAKCQNSNLICTIGFNYRFFDVTYYLQEIINTGVIGELTNVYIAINRLYRENWNTRETGALSDLGIHLIDYVMFITDQSIKLESCKAYIKYSGGCDYDAVVLGKTKQDVSFTMASARVESQETVGFKINIKGTTGDFIYDSCQRNMYKIRKKDDIYSYSIRQTYKTDNFFDFTDSIMRQDEEWINAITGFPHSQLASFYDGMLSQTALDYFIKNSTKC